MKTLMFECYIHVMEFLQWNILQGQMVMGGLLMIYFGRPICHGRCDRMFAHLIVTLVVFIDILFEAKVYRLWDLFDFLLQCLP